MRSRLGALGAAAIGFACSKAEAPEPPAPTEPWPAPAVQASAPKPVLRRYRIVEGRVRFEAPAKEHHPRGELPVVRGQLELDLEHPQTLSGSLELDLLALRVFAQDGETLDRDASTRARNWLGLGASVPEARRDRLRWARFQLKRVVQVQPRSLRRGPDPDAGRDAMSVRMRVLGDLVLHEVKAERELAITLGPASAEDQAPPGALVIETGRSLVVPLATHGIEPRDSTGTLLSQELKLLGKAVGREARVSARLVAVPLPAADAGPG